MNHVYYDELIQQARRDEDLRAAEHYRLIREALHYQPARRISLGLSLLVVLLAQVMAWLGSLLTNWSCQLKSRYVVQAASTQPGPCTGS